MSRLRASWSAWPLWIRALLLVLAAAGACARPALEFPDEEVRARAQRLRTELDPRRMSARELRQLPGVGERIALAIADTRDGQSADEELSWEDVPGIGEVRARAIRAWLEARGVEPDPLAGQPIEGASERYAGGVTPRPDAVLAALFAVLAGCGGGGGDPTTSTAQEPGRDAAGSDATGEVRSCEFTLESGTLMALEAGPDSVRVVLLLHGGRYRAETWRTLGTLERLSRAGFRALAIDWPGFGDSPAAARDVSPAERLGELFERAGIEQALIVAPSLGGDFAFDLIERDASRVAGFVPIAPAGIDEFRPPEGLAFPSLILWGEADAQLSPSRAAVLAAKLPGARIELLPGASHPCYLDLPERFHELLLGFAREVLLDER